MTTPDLPLPDLAFLAISPQAVILITALGVLFLYLFVPRV